MTEELVEKQEEASTEVNHKRHLGKDDEEPTSKKPKLDAEAYKQLKKRLAERKKALKQIPRVSLRLMGQAASLAEPIETRTPLFISDIQHLVMYSQIGHHSAYCPTRWLMFDRYNHVKHTYLVIVEGVSLDDFTENETAFPFLKEKFEIKLEVVNPLVYKGNLVHDLLMVPLTLTQVRTFKYQYQTLEKAWATKKIFNLLKVRFPITHERKAGKVKTKLPNQDKFSRVDLLLSGWQMVEENFPLPIRGLMEVKYRGYVCTKDQYKPVTSNSPMFGIDCEMCLTTARDNELTRVSIVNEKLEVVYETLVKPRNKIINYLTEFSGITPDMMIGVTKTLEEVQDDLRTILPADAILIGQSLQGDLHSLKIFHPYVIDTSIIFNLTGVRSRKSKLKLLMQEFLGETIQNQGSDGHCPTEDSMACLKLVQHKLSESLYYGDAVMSGDQLTSTIRYPELGKSNFAMNLFHHTTRLEKTAGVYADGDTLDVYKDYTYLGPSDKLSKKYNMHRVDGDKVLGALVDAKDNLNIGHVNWKSGTAEGFAELDSEIRKIFEAKDGPNLYIVLLAGHGLPDVTGGCAFITMKS